MESQPCNATNHVGNFLAPWASYVSIIQIERLPGIQMIKKEDFFLLMCRKIYLKACSWALHPVTHRSILLLCRKLLARAVISIQRPWRANKNVRNSPGLCTSQIKTHYPHSGNQELLFDAADWIGRFLFEGDLKTVSLDEFALMNFWLTTTAKLQHVSSSKSFISKRSILKFQFWHGDGELKFSHSDIHHLFFCVDCKLLQHCLLLLECRLQKASS
jgi:hypothetical protein